MDAGRIASSHSASDVDRTIRLPGGTLAASSMTRANVRNPDQPETIAIRASGEGRDSSAIAAETDRPCR